MKGENIHIEVGKMFFEFGEIILDEFPKGLPFVKRISHHIDLKLGSCLDNKEPHKINTT